MSCIIGVIVLLKADYDPSILTPSFNFCFKISKEANLSIVESINCHFSTPPFIFFIQRCTRVPHHNLISNMQNLRASEKQLYRLSLKWKVFKISLKKKQEYFKVIFFNIFNIKLHVFQVKKNSKRIYIHNVGEKLLCFFETYHIFGE